jgi:CubicO group peptidase (beta-lactamase class C family)
VRFRISTLIYLLLTLLGLAACGGKVTPTTVEGKQTAPPTQGTPEPPLRLSEPVDAITADLEHYIRERMREGGIPGLAISLIHDGQVVWTEGFGVANIITRQPVTPETVFEVASNSKVVAAHAALRLVEQGELSLDEPLEAYLSEPWLSASEYGDQITLRHLASHSLGLGDNVLPMDKSIAFDPGSDFLYSGVGALYVQEAIEQVTGTSLEDAAREIVFDPLGMSSSSFVNRADILPRMANGHMGYRTPLLAFVIPFAAVLMGIALLGVPILRISTGRWLPTWRIVIGACVVAAIVTLLGLALLAGKALPNLVLLIALCTAGFAIALAVLHLTGQQMIAQLPAAWHMGSLPRALQIAWSALSIIVLLWFVGLITGPLPKGPSPQPSAVGSMRTSAPDLAAFLIELAGPQHLSGEMAEQIRTPQMSAGRDMSWGLGPGIQHDTQGDALWQNGQTFGFRSVMVIYPEYGIGVVVLTNSDHGFPVVFDVAQRALGGSALSSTRTWLLRMQPLLAGMPWRVLLPRS